MFLQIPRLGSAAVLLIALCAASCGPAAVDARQMETPTRHFRSMQWLDEKILPDSGGFDTLFRAPTQPVSYAGGLVFADSYRGTVSRLRPDGSLMWSVPPCGVPAEPGSIRDAEADEFGRIWVLDQHRRSVIILDSLGAVTATLPIDSAGEPALSLIPLSARLVVHTAEPARPLTAVDAGGTRIGEATIPWDSLRRVHPLAAQVAVDRVPGGDLWVAALLNGDGFFVFDGIRPMGQRHPYVEHVDFPRIHTQTRREGASTVSVSQTEGRPVNAALSVAASPERLYVLFGGATLDRHRVVDAYALPTGEYVESYLLPRRTSQIAWSGGGLVTVSYEPDLTLRRLRTSAGRLP